MTLVPFPLRALNYERGSRRPWVAEVRGRDEKYEYDRKFLRPHRDWSEAGKKGKGPVLLWYTLREGRVYDVHRHVRGAKTERVFVAVRGGEAVEIDRAAVDAELNRRESELRRPLGVDVYSAARQRIAWVFDTFPRLCVSFSGGKDSTVLLHIAAEEARRRRRKIGLLFIDWEAQFSLTIAHVRRCFAEYADCTDPYWVSLPLTTVNACSQIEPEWVCWDPRCRDRWVREPEPGSITDPAVLPFYRPRMTFEEFTPAFADWYSRGQLSCSLVGLRAQESLRRLLSVTRQGKVCLGGRTWTAWVGKSAWNAYPVYDWRAEDVWTYTARERKSYNAIYDRMHQAGLKLSQMRVDEPFGDEARRGLWLAHALEPESWGRLVDRVAGAGQGAIYAGEANLGDGSISRPAHLTWMEYAELLLGTMPPRHAEHYRAKIAVWMRWYEANQGRAQADWADELPGDLSGKDQPSWRRVCKVLLKNDYWCKGLGFSPTKNSAYDRYRAGLRKKMEKWSGRDDAEG